MQYHPAKDSRDNRLSTTGIDLEVELVATERVSEQQAGDITNGA